MEINEKEIEENNPELFEVARKGGTERAFTGEHWDRHEEGMYRCKVCGAQLFDSGTKFDSGTGWPSFDQALEGAVEYKEDDSHGMVRTEVVCAKCGSHLGHVFDDGPAETTGKRYCINSVCLDFKKKE